MHNRKTSTFRGHITLTAVEEPEPPMPQLTHPLWGSMWTPDLTPYLPVSDILYAELTLSSPGRATGLF
jgi:hypothetical protein